MPRISPSNRAKHEETEKMGSVASRFCEKNARKHKRKCERSKKQKRGKRKTGRRSIKAWQDFYSRHNTQRNISITPRARSTSRVSQYTLLLQTRISTHGTQRISLPKDLIPVVIRESALHRALEPKPIVPSRNGDTSRSVKCSRLATTSDCPP